MPDHEGGPPAEAGGFAAVHETHIGVVFLVGDRAYKLKKPVDLGFVDFSTPERRRAACHREVELNRRLAPDVYLGVAEVSGVPGASTADDDVADYLVVMRRMPPERRLSTLVESGVDTSDTIDRLARMVAAFHAAADRGPEIAADATRDAIRQRWRDSFAQVHPLGVLESGLAAEIERLTLDFLAGREPLFDRRIAEGRVVDGHGDLLAGDIFCLEDGPRVLDCLEFDDRLRRLDGLDDIAFLAMDLERLGAQGFARRLLERYAEFAGDPAPAALRHHYVAYRAFVRAKVSCLRAAQGDTGSAGQARDYAELALRHLRAGRPRLVIVGGLPGTGKSTLAGLVADELGAVLISSDRLRKELAGVSPHDSRAAEYGAGIYSRAHTEHTYAELLRRAEELLSLGETVVLDASWIRAADRQAATETAARVHSEVVSLRCAAPAEVTAQRIRERYGDVSDADPRVAAAMAAEADPWPDATEIPTTGAPSEALAHARAALAPFGTE
ncbi:bifunctional aminoglycoside phosphotransferase/ATP-binding protein [Qaidamihabitans albus]|uniref:bifunctional aminoglycoside phosphotransferase/ATP-binding protein n=1 Tax=Qaidamihabitans albus TaxID=2795733 RepID=UPI0018F1C09D|nr:bifunctional aminoglycoside phosphotransferase/ATP-binding protein [Qaidamihabitans albus]